MTIKSKKTIQAIIDADGWLEGSQLCSVWQYDSENGERLYSFFTGEENDMWDSQYVYNPILLWGKDCGLIQNPD